MTEQQIPRRRWRVPYLCVADRVAIGLCLRAAVRSRAEDRAREEGWHLFAHGCDAYAARA